MVVKLSNSALGSIPVDIKVPTYDKTQLIGGIVHIGVGNFHRAYQSWYLHRLFEQGLNGNWAIIGAGVRKADSEMREKLRAQDCPRSTRFRVRGYGAGA